VAKNDGMVEVQENVSPEQELAEAQSFLEQRGLTRDRGGMFRKAESKAEPAEAGESDEGEEELAAAPVEEEPEAPTPTAPPTTRPTAPSPTTPPPTTRPRTPTPPLATVRGFTVHAEIADELGAMLDAAETDGITFGGSAYRSTERQIRLRIANCGPTDYDIWYRPASSCSPPTAVPGRSLHEQGRALDLTYDGRLITSRANLGFQWLAENAATYGFFNLPSEPWHWSTTGA